MTDSQGSLPAPPAPVPKSKLGLVALIVCLILSCAIFVFFWQANTNLSQQLKETRSTLAQVQTSITQSEGLNKRQTEQLLLGNQAAQASLLQLNEQVQFHSEQLSQLKNGNRLDWLLSETEYLLRLANQRLSLEKDPKGAELILSAADEVLNEANDPGLIAVRIALAEDILALQSLRQSDQRGAYARLDALITGVNQLPLLPAEVRTNEASDSSVDDMPDSALDQVWSELKSAIRISKVSSEAVPLLPPEQRYYLRQNLRLMLEQAVLALLNKDDTVYQHSLAKTEAWLQLYYSPSNPRVGAYLESISELKNYQFSSELPDISQSLRLLKAEIESMYRKRQLNQLNPEPIAQNVPQANTQPPSQVPETPQQESTTPGKPKQGIAP